MMTDSGEKRESNMDSAENNKGIEQSIPAGCSFKQYAIGILIAIGFYLVSMFLGSFVNVLISIAAGYGKYSDFIKSGNIAGLFMVAAFGLANHIFFGWLTVKAMTKYGKKQNCMTTGLFVGAAGAVVVLALTMSAGWMVYLSHSLSIILFGRSRVKKNAEAKPNPQKPLAQPDGPALAAENDAFIYCRQCGTKLNAGTKYCHECGSKVMETEQ